MWRKELEEAQEQLKAASALEEELEENISSLEEIMDSAVTLDTWIIRLTRMSVFRRPSSEHDEKRRKTFS